MSTQRLGQVEIGCCQRDKKFISLRQRKPKSTISLRDAQPREPGITQLMDRFRIDTSCRFSRRCAGSDFDKYRGEFLLYGIYMCIMFHYLCIYESNYYRQRP